MYCILVLESPNFFDDGIEKVIGTFKTEKEAQEYGLSLYNKNRIEVMPIIQPIPFPS